MPSTSTPVPSPQITLNADEARLLFAFRNMDERRQGELLWMASATAVAHPRRASRSLRLIVGGAA